MRRTLALIALLATSWPHAVALECAVASASRSGAEAGHEAQHRHGHGHAGTLHALPPGPSTATDDDVPTGGRECAMVMACGLTMLRTEGDHASAVPASRPEAGHVAAPETPTGAIMVVDPPPPRRHA